MNLADFTLARWRERRRAARRTPDFADMGTAFGLDASFAPTAPARSEPAAAAGVVDRPAARAEPRWWQRRGAGR